MEFSVGKDGDGAGNNVTMTRNEIAVFSTKRILPIIGKICQLRQRRQRTKSMTSSMFMRSLVVVAGAAAFLSSWL
ncbi:hypothetical protein CFP56_002174 [Quercus suber]|uniref:Uncharacterized protein n=1 Tax=Quercus suber TaxID=58331 RepID=A0AAW0MAX5_QUESU